MAASSCLHCGGGGVGTRDSGVRSSRTLISNCAVQSLHTLPLPLSVTSRQRGRRLGRAPAHASGSLPAETASDVLPHVQLAIDSVALLAPPLEPDYAQTQPDAAKQAALLLPRTHSRAQGMASAGYMPWRISGQVEVESPKHVAASRAWQEAAAWAASSDTAQMSKPLGAGAAAVPPWLQQLLTTEAPPHWATVAAVMHAAGLQLCPAHLALLVRALGASLGVRSLHSTATGSSNSSSCGSAAAEPPTLQLRLQPPSCSQTSVNGSNKASRGSSTSSDAPSSLLLQRSELLPQVTAALAQQLQLQPPQSQLLQEVAEGIQQQQQQQQQLGNVDAVQLLHILGELQLCGQVGAAAPDAVAALQSCINPTACSLQQLACAVSACAVLGHPLRSSWLEDVVSCALSLVESGQQLSAADLSAVVPLLLGLSRYPGPHAEAQRLQSLLQLTERQLRLLPPGSLAQLLCATTQLGQASYEEWRAAAADAAAAHFATAPLAELLALLHGAAAAGCSLDASWWGLWFDACASRAAAISLADAAAAAVNTTASTSISRDSTTAHNDSSWPSTLAAQQQQQQQQHLVDSSALYSSGGGWINDWDTSSSDDEGSSVSVPQVLQAEELMGMCTLLQALGVSPHPLWLAGMLQAYRCSAYSAAATPLLLQAVAALLEAPEEFGERHAALLQALLQPLRERLAELSADGLTAAAEACVVFGTRPGVEWWRWHAAAALRLGRTYPLALLARLRDAYAVLGVAPEQRARQLLDSVPWRLARARAKERAAVSAAARRATLTAKNEQRRRQNEADAASRAARGEGRAGWRRRKLRLPGTLDRRF